MSKQTGNGLAVFNGSRFQKGSGKQVGYGIGSFFKSLARKAMPFLQSGAKAVGKAALNTGMNIANDVASGKNFKQAATNPIKTTGKELQTSALSEAKRIVPKLMSGSGKPRQRGIKRRAPKKANTLSKASKAKRPKQGDQVDAFFKVK